MQEYYSAQCTNTKLHYEKKQLERTRDQLLGQWRTHDAASCQHDSSSSAMSGSMAATVTPATDVDVFRLSSFAVFSAAASRSTPVEELVHDDAPIDDDDDDTDDSDEEEEEERLDIIDEVLMQNLTDDMYDPLSRSLSCPASSGTESEYASMMCFVDQEVPPFPISDDPASSVSRTAAAAAATQGMDPIPQRMALPTDPHGRRSESSSTGGTTRKSIRSQSFPIAYVETAQCSLDTETRTGFDTIDVGDITAMPQVTPSTTTQMRQADIPLHVRSLSSDSDVDE